MNHYFDSRLKLSHAKNLVCMS